MSAATSAPPWSERIAKAIGYLTIRDGRPPTIREIGREVGIASTGHLQYHIDKLIDSGVLVHEWGVARGLRLATTGPVGAPACAGCAQRDRELAALRARLADVAESERVAS